MVAADESWFCYMVECGDASFYVGAAKNPGQRVKRHNWGAGSKHTALRRPVRLVWQEEHPNEGSARKREAELKGWRRSKKLELIAKAQSQIHPSP
jgi:putative endonuclease